MALIMWTQYLLSMLAVLHLIHGLGMAQMNSFLVAVRVYVCACVCETDRQTDRQTEIERESRGGGGGQIDW